MKPERLGVIRLVDNDGTRGIVVGPVPSTRVDRLAGAVQGAVWSVDTGHEGTAGALALLRELVAMAWEEGQPPACAWLTSIHREIQASAPWTEEQG